METKVITVKIEIDKDTNIDDFLGLLEKANQDTIFDLELLEVYED